MGNFNKIAEGAYRFVLIFSEHGCMRERVYEGKEGDYKILLSQEVTGKKEVQAVGILVSLLVRQEGWQIEGRILSEGAPAYFQLESGLEILVLLSERLKELAPCKRLVLRQEDIYRAGQAYQNQIFYECFSFVLSRHVEICYEDQAYVLQSFGKDGVYLNEQQVTGKTALHPGDRIDLYGLHMLVFKEMLVICCFCGSFRAAGRENIEELTVQKGELESTAKTWVERRWEEEEILHTGEVEILPPKAPERQRQNNLFFSLGPSITAIFPVILMAFAGSYLMQGTGGNFYYLSLLMSVCSSVLALFWGLTNHFYARRQSRKKEESRVTQYREYLDRTEKYLLTCQEENRRALEKKYPPASFFLEREKGAVVLWNRYYLRRDFLFLRIGIGSIPFQITLKRSRENTIVTEKLAQEAGRLVRQYEMLFRAPVGIDFRENRLLGLLGEERSRYGVLLQILFQIAACHSYTEVKVVCFYEKQDRRQREIADCIRWMPHSWSADGRVRFLSGGEKESGEILPVLSKELEKGKESLKEGKGIPWYLVVILAEEQIQGEPVYQYLTEAESSCPVSGILLKKTREELPAGCDCFLRVTEEKAELVRSLEEKITKQELLPESCEEGQLQKYLRQISGYRVKEGKEDGQLPEQVDFLTLYQITSIKELFSKSRWERNRPEERLKIPLGLGKGGVTVHLDIHEKFHGPHGLIAGTTGSGKSELIQTFLLSMAVSFSPQDVNFFMIDYKGGGTGNALQSLPHCAGVISNLSGKQIKRAMSAISSENKRRQKLLSKYQVNHIDAYMELYRQGGVQEPMPHLVLVVDEFAELKKEEPEFMQEIISLAQVGRSLGMHLILATQKPAGTVDDKIWSNARFRLCLRVQDSQDSMDMLHKKDAAMLTLPGQCYLQIGNHEYYELFQTGYCGGAYIEGGAEKEKALLVSDTGKRTEVKKKEAWEVEKVQEKEKTQKKKKSQLEVIVDYVKQTAEENHYERARSLWMPELPECISLEELSEAKREETKGVEEGKYLLGLCDDPGNQSQYPAFYVPVAQGHLAVCGGPATGKTTLLQTLLWQLGKRRLEDVRVVIVDLNGGSLRAFERFPHCMGVLKQKEEKPVFLYHLEKLVKERKEILSGISHQQYNRAENEKLPEIFLVIDHYGSFFKILEERWQEFMLQLATEGINLGIYLVLSAAGVGEIPGRLFEKIKKTIALEISDRFLYGDILRQYHITVFPKENVKGRGLCREKGQILEFQTALAFAEKEDYLRMKGIEKAGEKMQESYRERGMSLPERFPSIPKNPDTAALYQEFSIKERAESLPLGYDLETGEVEELSLRKMRFLISGSERSGRRNLLSHLAEGLLQQGMQVVILDMERQMTVFKDRENVKIFHSSEEMSKWQMQIKEMSLTKADGSRMQEQTETKLCLLLMDLAAFVRWIYQPGEGSLERQSFWEKEAKGEGHFYFLAGIYQPEGDYETPSTQFFREFTVRQQGIHLGGNLAAQRVLNFDDVSYSLQNQREKPGIGYLKSGRGSETKRLRLPIFIEMQKQTDVSGRRMEK